MALPALVQDILEGVRSRPGRFGLALFAMTIGMAVLTLLIALLGGLEQRSEALSNQLGTNVIAILSETNAQAHSLTVEHTNLLRKNYPDAAISGMQISQASIPGQSGTTTVVAVEDAFFDLRQWPLRAGRLFDENDITLQKRHALVTDALLQKLGWQLGSTILLRNTPFQIIGIVGANDSALNGEYGDQRLSTGELAIFVPLSVSAYWDDSSTPGNNLDAVYIQPSLNTAASAALPGLRSLLAQPDIQVKNLSWVIPASLIKKVRAMQSTVGLTVGTIAILCLVLGGTTLTSLLVANVRERIAEIGLRRAMGATQWDIATLFMAEGCVATLGAAMAGAISVHIVLAQNLTALAKLPLDAGLNTLLLPMGFSLLLGIIFSAWPALSAARIRPAAALRND